MLHEDDSDYENDSDDYDDDGSSNRKGKRKRNEKPKKVYANAKISNKGYDTSQFVSSFRKALVPISNHTLVSFGSNNSEHVRRKFSNFECKKKKENLFVIVSGSIYSIASFTTI